MTGYFVGAGLMIAAGLVELVLGVDAAQRSLEDIATPLTAEDTDDDGADGDGADDAGRDSRTRKPDARSREPVSTGSSRRLYH